MNENEQNQVQGMLDNYEQQLRERQNALTQTQESLMGSTLFSQENQNLIVFQLELDNTLEKIEHLLRGDLIQTDRDGNVSYKPTKDPRLKPMNDYGVQLIMEIIACYINRNTILSYYDPERIDEILADLGDELADLIFCNYEKMGMDTKEKQSRYNLLVLSILNMIESTYRRSLNAGERESLRTGRMVMQNERSGAMMQTAGVNPNMKKFKVFDPRTW